MGSKTMLLLLLLSCLTILRIGSGATDPRDTSALRSLMNEWQNTPPNWGQSDDPCGTPWDGITCNNSRVITLRLSSKGIKGTLSGDIGQLTELRSLVLDSNTELGGRLTPSIGTLKKLKTLILAGCSFTDSIPDELGNLRELSFLLLDVNMFTGPIPCSLGLVQSLEVIRLDQNFLNGPVPSNINNLTHLNHLNLANNKLTGPVPDLTGMSSLDYVDLSNNTFDPTETPPWFSTLESLYVLMMESAGLYGEVPKRLFSSPHLQQVILLNNKFNGSLDMGSNISSHLQFVNFMNNSITSLSLTASYNNTLILAGNPVCTAEFSHTKYCQVDQAPYSIRV